MYVKPFKLKHFTHLLGCVSERQSFRREEDKHEPRGQFRNLNFSPSNTQRQLSILLNFEKLPHRYGAPL